MELTENDIGRTFLWLSGAARLATLIDLNPADDDDVKIAPDSGGKVWVNPAELFPVRQGSNPTAVAALINIAQDLVEFERIRAHVRELLEMLDKPGYTNDLCGGALDAVAHLRADVGVIDPLHDPEVFELPLCMDKFGRVHPGPVDDDGNPVHESPK